MRNDEIRLGQIADPATACPTEVRVTPASTATTRPAISPPDRTGEGLESWYYEALSRRDPILGFASTPIVRMIADSPTLLSRHRELHEQRETSLVAALGDPFEAKVEAAMLAGVLKACSTRSRPGLRTAA